MDKTCAMIAQKTTTKYLYTKASAENHTAVKFILGDNDARYKRIKISASVTA